MNFVLFLVSSQLSKKLACTKIELIPEFVVGRVVGEMASRTTRNSKIQWKEIREGEGVGCLLSENSKVRRVLINSIRAKEAGNCTVLFRYVLSKQPPSS